MYLDGDKIRIYDISSRYIDAGNYWIIIILTDEDTTTKAYMSIDILAPPNVAPYFETRLNDWYIFASEKIIP